MMDINDIKNHINNKSRLIGVDMGSKRVGLSISDENRKIAIPLKTINYVNIQILIDELENIIRLRYDIMNFGENTGCYGVKTTEIDCPHYQPNNENFDEIISFM